MDTTSNFSKLSVKELEQKIAQTRTLLIALELAKRRKQEDDFITSVLGPPDLLINTPLSAEEAKSAIDVARRHGFSCHGSVSGGQTVITNLTQGV